MGFKHSPPISGKFKNLKGRKGHQVRGHAQLDSIYFLWDFINLVTVNRGPLNLKIKLLLTASTLWACIFCTALTPFSPLVFK